MKRALWISVFLVFLSVLSGCGGGTNASTLPPEESQFVVLKEALSPDGSVFTKKQAKVIFTQADYEAELANYTNVAPDSFDFSKGRVLLVDMGPRSSGGYSVRIASVDVADSWVVVNVELVTPGPECIVTASLTNPYQFIFIPTLKEILLSEKMLITNC